MDWFNEEMKTIDLGDKRLNERSKRLLDIFSNKPETRIPVACNGWHETKAAYRFFNNPKVTSEKIFKPHVDATLQRIRKVLVSNLQTSVNIFTTLKITDEFQIQILLTNVALIKVGCSDSLLRSLRSLAKISKKFAVSQFLFHCMYFSITQK